jgi:hypothetical protein
MAGSILEKDRGLNRKKDLLVNIFELPWTAG